MWCDDGDDWSDLIFILDCVSLLCFSVYLGRWCDESRRWSSSDGGRHCWQGNGFGSNALQLYGLSSLCVACVLRSIVVDWAWV
ncbi:hypothetical protein ACLB2K_063678 [Fragaria x ananassa]